MSNVDIRELFLTFFLISKPHTNAKEGKNVVPFFNHPLIEIRNDRCSSFSRVTNTKNAILDMGTAKEGSTVCFALCCCWVCGVFASTPVRITESSDVCFRVQSGKSQS